METRVMRRISLLLIILLHHATAIEGADLSATSRVIRAVGQSWDSALNYYNSLYSSVSDNFGFKQSPTIMHTPSNKCPFSDFNLDAHPPHFQHAKPQIPAAHVIYPTTLFAGTPVKPISCGDFFLGQCDSTSRYRTFDGSCNNLRNPTWGMTGTRYARLLPAIYSDGVHAAARSSSNQELPPPRVVSYTLFPDVEIADPIWTLALMQWGQIVAHDMSLIAGSFPPRPGVPICCTDERVLITELLGDDQCLPIIVSKNDPDFEGIQCLPFYRGATDLDSGCPIHREPAEQLTSVTHFLDLSVLYGPNDQVAQSLRAMVGGQLTVEVRCNRHWIPRALNQTTDCDPAATREQCYGAGDERANQNTQLTVLQTILLREHNRVAGQLALMNPHWIDETIYQETRRIVTAMHQQISYYEWLPIFIGGENAYNNKIIYRTDGYVDDYDPSVNPTVLNEHSTAAFRSFHSLIAGYLKLVSEQRSSRGALRLSDWFGRPGIIERNNNFDDLTRGLADQPQEAQDEYYVKEITVHMFRKNKPFGIDLHAMDIQRNRDHGLATYNDLREHCGMSRANTWEDLENVMDPANVKKLSELYERPSDIDLIVGGSLEYLVQGTLAGPTFLCILTEQFYRTRVGDRFWFESPKPDVAFTIEQLKEIRKASIARWFCDGGDRIQNMQHRAFQQPSASNPITKCQDIPKVDLSLWKDYGPQLAGHQETSHFQQRGSVFYKK